MSRAQGRVHPRYTKVRDVFAEQFRSGSEIGAAVAILVDGEPVVDLFAGHADPARTRPWTADTIAHVYSVTKGMTALCAHRLLERVEQQFGPTTAFVGEFGPVMVVHTGPGLAGLAWWWDDP